MARGGIAGAARSSHGAHRAGRFRESPIASRAPARLTSLNPAVSICGIAMSDVVHKRLIGRRCNSLLVYEAHDSSGLVDGAALIVLVLGQPEGGEEWVRVFFDAGGWSWTTSNEPVAEPE